MNIGTLFRAKAVKNVFGGDAITRVAGEVVFVPGVLAGEEFVGRITKVNKDYARAEAVEITRRSEERIENFCSGAGRCPGCAYAFCSHAAEQQSKLRQLQDFLKPLGVEKELVQGCKLDEAPEEYYRNKIRLTMRKAGGEAQLGYVFPDGKMYPLSHCRLASRAINEKLASLLQDPGFVPSLHDRMTITFRESADGVTIFRNSPGKNAPLLRETVSGKDFYVPQDGFFQVNKHGLEVLMELVKDVLTAEKCRYFIDAYAGSGLFGCAAAEAKVPYIVGVEENELSAATAKLNWKNFGAGNFDFHTGDAAVILPEILKNAPADAVAVFDPPRGGMDGRAIRTLQMSPLKKLIYISCHPATLVRDLERLQRGGFSIAAVRMIDMFPRSVHFETFVQLKR
ncbi:MAG: class I SAM-dependent RNA methyltransferase [Lentisphaerae bacterium]|nr:class I SAM-dependent RNA methyltransferase [Lentisphaerota bacterium]